MKKRKLVYVAGKYSAPTDEEIKRNVEHAAKVGLDLIRMGFDVIIPHKNTDGFHKEDIPYERWMELSLNILSRCDAIYMLKGWRESKGAKKEYEFACNLKLEILFE